MICRNKYYSAIWQHQLLYLQKEYSSNAYKKVRPCY